jgi:hypothetical protein
VTNHEEREKEYLAIMNKLGYVKAFQPAASDAKPN